VLKQETSKKRLAGGARGRELDESDSDACFSLSAVGFFGAVNYRALFNSGRSSLVARVARMG